MQRSTPRRLVAMVSPDGVKVEQILVQRSLRRPPRQMLRVTHRGRWIADCTSVFEVSEFVDLASLHPVES